MKRISLAAVFVLAISMGSVSAEESAPSKPTEPTVSVVTAMGVQASVTFEGDYGPSRLEGSLLALPEEPIQALEGKVTKEIPVRHLQELQRTPLGVGPDALSTYQLTLFSGETYILQPDKLSRRLERSLPRSRGIMQVASVPKAVIELKTELFGVVRIPFPKLLQLTVQPVNGTLREAPSVPVPLQVLEGVTLSVPFQRITNFRRDPMGGTATVSFGIAEGVTGKVADMPTGSILVRTPDGQERRIPLSEIVQYTLEGPITLAVNPAPAGPAPREPVNR